MTKNVAWSSGSTVTLASYNISALIVVFIAGCSDVRLWEICRDRLFPCSW